MAEQNKPDPSDLKRKEAIIATLIERLKKGKKVTRNKETRDLAGKLYTEEKNINTAISRLESLQNYEKAPLTTGKLVDLILRSLKADRQALTYEEIFTAFDTLIQLTPEERNALNEALDNTVIKEDDSERLFKQASLNIHLYQNQQQHDRILALYKASVTLDDNLSEHPLQDLEEVEGYIDELCDQEQEPVRAPYLPYPCSDLERLKGKVKRALKRLLLQAGTSQVRHISLDDQAGYIKRYLPRSFVNRFTQAVIENHYLTQEFAVQLKSIALNQVGPLPIPVQGKAEEGYVEEGLLSSTLLEFMKERDVLRRNNVPINMTMLQLASVHAYEATLHFYAKPPEGYKPFSERVYQQLQTVVGPSTRVHFSVRSTGLGGTISHLTKILNTAIFWDIACLRLGYFPIAHDLIGHRNVVRNNVASPVWAHCHVQLCRNSVIAEAMKESCRKSSVIPYEQFAFAEPQGRGDYCDLDELLSIVRAESQARLRAIKATGITPDTYLTDLLYRIEQQHILNEGCSFITEYPFSSFAQKSWLKKNLIDQCLKGFELDLISLELIENLPSEGKNLVIIAKILDSYHVRIFNIQRKKIIDQEFSPKRKFKESLNNAFENQGKGRPISDKDKNDLVEKVFSEFSLTNLEGKTLHITREKPYVVFNAYLTLIETFLSEGAYRQAYQYLQELYKPEVLGALSEEAGNWYNRYNRYEEVSITASEANSCDFHVFSGIALIRYELCLAEYYYLVDLKAEDRNSIYLLGSEATQTSLVRHAWQALNRAEKHLTIRLVKYAIINEVSQAAFYPYYRLLSRLSLLQSKIFIFFSEISWQYHYIDQRQKHWLLDYVASREAKLILAPLYLLEWARVYAVVDADIQGYVVTTTYQCLAYVMASFLSPRKREELSSSGDPENQRKNWPVPEQQQCYNWVRKLRNHALLTYAETGRRCYHQTKEKSGLDKDLEQHSRFEQYDIDQIPVIQETLGATEPGLSTVHGSDDEEIKVLSLDIKYLVVSKREIDPHDKRADPIYLFGPQACYLFFIRGLYHLCSSDRDEFSKSEESLSPENLSEWDAKLEQCYRLFSYAWAMADDGCKIEDSKDKGVEQKIKRDFTGKSYGITDPHVASVRDLYPLRITEIASLGRVFAAACAVLRLHTQGDQEGRETRLEEMRWLLENLHREDDIENDYLLKEALEGQKRYNGHLEERLRQFRDFLYSQKNEIKKSLAGNDSHQMQSIKSDFLEGLFRTLN